MVNTNLDTTSLPPNNLVAQDPQSAELAGYVRTKTFGRDVREAIARSIELNSTRSKSAEELANETVNVANDLTDRFNAQIGALTEDSEVIDARNGYLNLRERLDNLTNVIKVDDYAIGDGITDDTEAIQSAFNKASAENKDILFGNKTYIYNPTSTLEFSNGINFGKSIIKRTDSLSEGIPIVKLVHSKPKVTIDVSTLTTPINRKTLQIPELAGHGHAYVQIEDDTKRIFKRQGVANDNGLGVAKFDHFTIDNEGYVLDEITYDFDNVTNLTVQPTDNSFTVIEGGGFYNDSKGTTANYFRNGLVIEKSNVVIRNIYHTLETDQNASPTDGFIYIANCANVTLENVRFEARTTNENSYGTYDFSATKVVNLTLRHIHAPHYTDDKWGFMGGNFIKNLLVEKCNVNRIDAHMGVHNLTIRDSALGRKGIAVSGYGKMFIENIKAYSPYVIDLRRDYGASWDGEISINGINQIRTKDEPMGLINAEFRTDFDYGDTGRFAGLGTKLNINNYTFDNNNITTTGSNWYVRLVRLMPTTADVNVLKYTYYLPHEMTFDNCLMTNKVTGSEGFVFITDANMAQIRARKHIKDSDPYRYDTNVKVVLNNIEFAEFYFVDWRSVLFVNSGGSTIGQQGDDTYGQVLNRAYWSISILNSNKLHINLLGRYVRLFIQNSEISSLLGESSGSRSWFKVESSTIRPRVSAEGVSLINARFDRYQFSNCTFEAPLVGDINTIQANPFVGAYENILNFETVGGNITPLVYMSGCRLGDQIALSNIKTDLSNYDFNFGNFVPYRLIYPIKGSTRPTGLKVGLQFYDTNINKLIIYDGSNWRQADGTLAN